MNLDTKIEVSYGLVDWMQKEITSLRNTNKDLGSHVALTERFLNFAESIHPRSNSVGYGEDRMYQAKREIEEAVAKKQREQAEGEIPK